MDPHVHAAITDGLRRRGAEVITAQEDGATRFDDERLLERATQLGCVLFSQDKDLLILTHRWLQTDRKFAGLVYAHQLSVAIGQAVRDLEVIAKAFDPQDMCNRIEFIPL
jgi:hypothetical protein